MREYIKNNKFNILTLVLYSIITLVIVFFHENWRDEAQSWLIARDLNFIDIIKQMKYEGHPCLWHFILLPFAKLGFPYITENIISWIIMNISVWILIKKAPFDKYIKILILLTSPFLYLLPVISRNYCLIALGITLIATTYKKRKSKPIEYILSLVLLSFTHIIMLGLVGMLYFFFFFEELVLKFKEKNKEQKKAILISFFIAVISLIFLAIQLMGALQTNANVNSNIKINEKTFMLIFNAIKQILGILFGVEFIYIILLLSIILLIYEIIKHPKNAVIISVSIGFQLFVYACIYSVSEQRATTILLIILLFIWIQQDENKNLKSKKTIIPNILLSIILTFNVITSYMITELDIKYSYSGAKEVSKYINENINCSEAVFVSSHIPITSAIIPYTTTNNYWSPQLDKYFSFTIWDKKNENQNLVPVETILYNTEVRFKDKEKVYFIYCYNWNENDLEYFIEKTSAIELFRTETDIIRSDEKYIIYKLYTK